MMWVGIIFILAAIYWLWFSPTSQVFGRFDYRLPTTKKIVALTFDDGPNPPYTNTLLDVLQKHQVRATFFLVGKNLEKYPEIGKKIVADGHQIGNHTYSHSFSKNFNAKSIMRDIEINQNCIEKILGQRPTLFRPPWLFRQPRLLQYVRRNNLVPVSGTFGSEREIFQPPARSMAKRALQQLRPGAILIFHDGYNASGSNRAETVAAIDLLISLIKARGFTFVTLESLSKELIDLSRVE